MIIYYRVQNTIVKKSSFGSPPLEYPIKAFPESKIGKADFLIPKQNKDLLPYRNLP